MDLCQEGREQGRHSTQREQQRATAEGVLEPGAGRTPSNRKDYAKAIGAQGKVGWDLRALVLF